MSNSNEAKMDLLTNELDQFHYKKLTSGKHYLIKIKHYLSLTL